MTADVAAWPVGARLADRYRRLRSAHPVHVLRWLRNGMLLTLAAAALLYLWVAIQAGSDIAAARRTQQANNDLGSASSAVKAAGTALDHTFSHEYVPLVGTGSDFVSQINQVNKYLTLAAENNAAGMAGTLQIQYVENQFTSYLQLSENAVTDSDHGNALGQAGQGYAADGEANVLLAIGDVVTSEKKALTVQRESWALNPWWFWWALLVPALGVLAFFMATASVLAHRFRRGVSPLLWAALLITTLTMITAGVVNSADAQRLTATPWTGSPVAITLILLLLAAAAAMAARAYQPRLAEYRFDPS